MTPEREYNSAFADYLEEITRWYKLGLAKTKGGVCPIASHLAPKIDQAIRRDDYEPGYAAKFLRKTIADLERIRNERMSHDKTQLPDGEGNTGSSGAEDAGESTITDDREN